MKLAILQPVLIPNLHDLTIIKSADMVVIQDCEQWSRKGRTHRALIRSPKGTQYLNIPVVTEDRKKQIREVRIDHTKDWIKGILRSLRYNYRNSVYYDFYEPEIQADFLEAENFEYLMEFAMYLKGRIFQFIEFEPETEIVFGSNLDDYHSDPDKLAKALGADSYFQEHDSRHYQRQGESRVDAGFRHPIYRQHFDGFEPWCCLLDLLFQYGPESFRVYDKC